MFEFSVFKSHFLSLLSKGLLKSPVYFSQKVSDVIQWTSKLWWVSNDWTLSTMPSGNVHTEWKNIKYCWIINDPNIFVYYRKFSLHHRVQTGSGAHPASDPMGTRGSFPGGKAAVALSWPLPSI
jgi:hypothetical protein